MIALLFFANTHLRDVFWYDVFCEAILFLEPNSTRSVLHCGRGNEKQTRTLTDTEDCCEDVCIVLICGWSVDVLCQHPSSDTAVWHMSVKRQHSHRTSNCGLCTSGLNDPLPLSQIVQTRLLDDLSRRHHIKQFLLIGRKSAPPHRTSRPRSAL